MVGIFRKNRPLAKKVHSPGFEEIANCETKTNARKADTLSVICLYVGLSADVAVYDQTLCAPGVLVRFIPDGAS